MVVHVRDIRCGCNKGSCLYVGFMLVFDDNANDI